MAKEENLKRETESPLIAAQNNAIRINYMKAKIKNTQQNCKCTLCGDREETINHIISDCNKLAQNDWVGKDIHLELCKRLKFKHIAK